MKKKRIIFYFNGIKTKISFFAVLIIIAAAVISAVILGVSAKSPETENTPKTTIVVDAGHGDFDGGAVRDNILEKDINLKIALKLSEILQKNGFNVILTRKDDTALNTSGNSIATKKVSDMKNRLKLTENSGADMFVSIHQNKYSAENAKGAQVFYGVKNPKSENLAQSIQNAVKTDLQPENRRVIKKGTKDTYLLLNITVPAVIVECGFLSNNKEFFNLQSEDYQNKMASAIYKGIKEYKNKE